MWAWLQLRLAYLLGYWAGRRASAEPAPPPPPPAEQQMGGQG